MKLEHETKHKFQIKFRNIKLKSKLGREPKNSKLDLEKKTNLQLKYKI